MELDALQKEKENLLNLKRDGLDFTEEQQARLVEVTGRVADLTEQIGKMPDEKPKTEKPKTEKPKDGYTPERGTEGLIHLSISKGRRFDENTGKELTKPYVQMMSYGEYQNFKKSAEQLGYTYVVLHNPFND